MYLKSTHSQLADGGHQWEVTLFCHTEANSIGHVDIIPKSKGSKVIPNDARPAPTAYTMVYITNSRLEVPPIKFTATITFLKTNEKKIVSVPANMATDRKRRKADGLTDDEDGASEGTDENRNEITTEKPPVPQEGHVKRKRGLFAVFCGGRSSSKEFSEKESENAAGCCCTIM